MTPSRYPERVSSRNPTPLRQPDQLDDTGGKIPTWQIVGSGIVLCVSLMYIDTLFGDSKNRPSDDLDDEHIVACAIEELPGDASVESISGAVDSCIRLIEGRDRSVNPSEVQILVEQATEELRPSR